MLGGPWAEGGSGEGSCLSDFSKPCSSLAVDQASTLSQLYETIFPHLKTIVDSILTAISTLTQVPQVSHKD